MFLTKVFTIVTRQALKNAIICQWKSFCLLQTYSQKLGEDFSKIFGLLRINELYLVKVNDDLRGSFDLRDSFVLRNNIFIPSIKMG